MSTGRCILEISVVVSLVTLPLPDAVRPPEQLFSFANYVDEVGEIQLRHQSDLEEVLEYWTVALLELRNWVAVVSPVEDTTVVVQVSLEGSNLVA